MGQKSSGDEDMITEINVTPLVDVMPVLLIIFMVTTTYIVNRSIQVKLPKAETGEEQIQSKNLAFVIDSASQLFLDGVTVALEDVAGKIEAIKKDLPPEQKLQALISADQSTPHGQVVKLIDAVRKGGINEFAINVELPTQKAP